MPLKFFSGHLLELSRLKDFLKSVLNDEEELILEQMIELVED